MEIKRGISLIVLVITIIVIIILASAVILSLSNNNPIAQANEATFKSDIDAYNSELTLTLSKKYVDNPTLNAKQLNATTWDGVSATTGTVKEYIPSMSTEDCKNYAIDEGRLVYVGSDTTELNWLRASKIIPTTFKFNYTGSVQTFTAPIAGTYTIEVWGASGGGDPVQTVGSHKGLGGYSKGDYTLTAGQSIYFYVGGQGIISTGLGTGGGWNGGGHGSKGGSSGYGGGGATDVRTVNGLWNDATSLAARVIVAGGGGGSDNLSGALGASDDGSGGAGGGLSGEDARINGVYSVGTGATQTIGTLGIGQDATAVTDTAGGGGGYRGGLATNNNNGGAGGGSGYIGGVTNGVTQTGGNEGNGYARITLI